MFCLKCGAPITTGMSYCPACGHPLNKKESEESPAHVSNPEFSMEHAESVKKNVPLFCTTLLGFILGVSFLIWTFWTSENLSSNPQKQLSAPTLEIIKTIEEQLKALRSHDFNKAYYSYTTKEFQKETTFEEFLMFLRNYAALAKNQGIEFKETDLTKNQATVVGLLILEQGFLPIEYSLAQEEGKWKIWGIQLTEQPIIKPRKSAMVETPISSTNRELQKKQKNAFSHSALDAQKQLP